MIYWVQHQGGDSVFFDLFAELCKKNKVTAYKACTDIGLNRSAVAKWKKGATPNGTTLAKIADYFGVSTDFLLGTEHPTGNTAEPLQDADIKFALFGDTEIDDEVMQSVREFGAFAKANWEKKEREKNADR